jgi:hypothetical protein
VGTWRWSFLETRLSIITSSHTSGRGVLTLNGFDLELSFSIGYVDCESGRPCHVSRVIPLTSAVIEKKIISKPSFSAIRFPNFLANLFVTVYLIGGVLWKIMVDARCEHPVSTESSRVQSLAVQTVTQVSGP